MLKEKYGDLNKPQGNNFSKLSEIVFVLSIEQLKCVCKDYLHNKKTKFSEIGSAENAYVDAVERAAIYSLRNTGLVKYEHSFFEKWYQPWTEYIIPTPKGLAYYREIKGESLYEIIKRFDLLS